MVGHQVGQKGSQDLKTTQNFSQGHGKNLMILSNYYYNWRSLKYRLTPFSFFNLAPLIAMITLKGVPPQKLQALPELLVVVSQ